jgi:hypothetical protein
MTTPEDKAGWAVAQSASFVAAVERLITRLAER